MPLNNRNRTKTLFFYEKKLLTFVLSSCLTLFSQEQNKPKVGLVLSGGGAKGFAHRF
jgi:NTE family protein